VGSVGVASRKQVSNLQFHYFVETALSLLRRKSCRVHYHIRTVGVYGSVCKIVECEGSLSVESSW
jgi:hypothetical protein